MGKGGRRQPLYDQLVDLLHDKIADEMAPGDILASERELSETYCVSRTTVRLALRELEEMGLIERRHGRGTYVSDRRLDSANLMTSYSFTEQMLLMGRKPSTKILEFEICESPRHIAKELGISEGERVFRMRRLRIADDVPMMVERTYLPAGEFIGLSRKEIEEKPLYDIIEKDFRQIIKVAEEEFCASVARSDEVELLQISEGAPVLQLWRTTFNLKNKAIEYTRSIARADQFRYKVAHYR